MIRQHKRTYYHHKRIRKRASGMEKCNRRCRQGLDMTRRHKLTIKSQYQLYILNHIDVTHPSNAVGAYQQLPYLGWSVGHNPILIFSLFINHCSAGSGHEALLVDLSSSVPVGRRRAVSPVELSVLRSSWRWGSSQSGLSQCQFRQCLFTSQCVQQSVSVCVSQSNRPVQLAVPALHLVVGAFI